MAATLGRDNPLRYRGYVYDTETGLYYLKSRYYNPDRGRFINADNIISKDEILGANQFAYCDNNPIKYADYDGHDGQLIDLGKGWWCRIDPQKTGTGTQRHIHIWNDEKSYSQNEDGSPHDKNKNLKGPLDKKVNERLVEKVGWDYNGKRDGFYKKTEIVTTDSCLLYQYANGETATTEVPFSPLVHDQTCVFENVFYNRRVGNVVKPGGSMHYLPVPGHIAMPAFSFSYVFSPYMMIA